MIRIALAVAAGVGCAAQAELIEYRLWGQGSFHWTSTEPLTAPGVSSWVQQSAYEMRFVANTDNAVADGLGGYSLAVDFAELTLGAQGATPMPRVVLQIDADGVLGFFSTRYNMPWMTISADVLSGFDLATSVEPLIQQFGTDPGTGDSLNWWQDASFANLQFLSTPGGRGYGVLDEMNLSVTRGVPTPGALGLLALCGVVAGRRRR